ncbi:4Fe-4S single cluster domain-containing protein [Nonomuraea typhae]|uniref:4Fe-4S single cluster domain-containing protein n=1 Tax=Nonomuraea typhae TaxID=2603600 RepID=UPI0012F8E6EA|nr:4Fe-4S single cluster domain-containing protein [Nonomuraea typhae]
MTTTLRVNRVHSPVTTLGYGRRLGIWTQGCPLACPGCMSRDTWDPAAGAEVPVDRLAALWREAVRGGADGLTISGGEPLTQPEGLAALLTAAHEIRSGTARELDLLVFTGYEESELDDAQRAAVRHADVLITGRYEAGRPTGLIWRGSAGQHMLLRTELAERRYQPFVGHTPDSSPMQVAADEHGVWLIGVPASGTLPRLERALRTRGVELGPTSWRPDRRP